MQLFTTALLKHLLYFMNDCNYCFEIFKLIESNCSKSHPKWKWKVQAQVEMEMSISAMETPSSMVETPSVSGNIYNCSSKKSTTLNP